MRILCCVKRVPITGGKMVLTADGQALETKHLGFTISPHEECAVEEAVRIGGEVVVLTLGPLEAEEQLRDCMAIGADRGILLKTNGEEWDAQATAAAIVDTIRGEEPFDLILFGNESADAAGYQVGIRVAHALGLPVVTGLKKIEVGDGSVRCERDLGGARDVYEAPLPAVLTVLEGLNLPRYPSVPGRLRAKSKPLDVVEPASRPAQLEKLRLRVPEGQGKQAELLADATQVVAVLQSIGVA
jgi:electron transfer flavoprotein beta subunit